MLRPEIIDGGGRSLRDSCREIGLCPGLGLAALGASDLSAACFGRGEFSLPNTTLLTFPAPNECEAMVLSDATWPSAPVFARTGVNLGCPCERRHPPRTGLAFPLDASAGGGDGCLSDFGGHPRTSTRNPVARHRSRTAAAHPQTAPVTAFFYEHFGADR